MNTIQLSAVETKVACLIPRGLESPIKVKELSKLCGVPERKLYEVINRLVKYGVPICAVRSTQATSGLFIATTEQERRLGISALASQVDDMYRRLAYVRSADIDNWGKKLIMHNAEVTNG